MTNGLRTQLILQRHGFRYTHSLGQNFIFDDEVIGQIVAAAGVFEGQNIVEIGPGAGMLTAALLRRGANVLAVEIDRKLKSVLSEMLEGMPRVKLVFEDIMKLDLRSEAHEFFGKERFSVVANLPYYITADILLSLLKSGLLLDAVTVTVQKEAAQRVMAEPGEKQYSALSTTVQYFGSPSVLMEIPNAAFTPKPHVESCLLRIDLYDKKPVEAKDERLLLRMIAACFAMRRKTLANNLMSAFSLERERAEALIESAGFEKKARGEELSIGQIVHLCNMLSDET